MVRNVSGSNALNAMCSPSELDPGQSLGVDDPRDRTDLVDDDLTKDIEIFRLDFRDEIVLPKQRVELHDFLDLEELVVHFVLLRGGGANEHESDSRPWSPRWQTTDAI